jgi:hypothetical protein
VEGGTYETVFVALREGHREIGERGMSYATAVIVDAL